MADASPPAPLATLASCIAGYDAEALGVPQAQAFIARLVPRVQAVERLALRAALSRVLAHDIVSAIDVPAHDNSAMDGYALRGAELAANSEPERDTVLRIAGHGLAGDAFIGQVNTGECVRIMTGAVMPAGLDTVVPQELVRVIDANHIGVPAGAVRAGDNRRRAGEDLARGETALTAGRVLRPADLGLLASLGQAEIAVRRRLRVAFFSTGNELRSLGEPLPPGGVYDSNRYTLWGMLQRLGVEPIDLGVVRDEPAALEAALRSAAACADAVITSGGVSVGEADHTKAVMAGVGEVLFWQIAMRPGRPMAIGRITRGRHLRDGGDANDAAILFGLPGNPVAVMVSFYALVRDALLAMSGATAAPLPMLRARSVGPIRKRPGRTEYQRGIVSRGLDGHGDGDIVGNGNGYVDGNRDGDWQVRLTGAQGSGVLRSMSEANGLVVLPHSAGPVAAGEWVDVLPFDGLI